MANTTYNFTTNPGCWLIPQRGFPTCTLTYGTDDIASHLESCFQSIRFIPKPQGELATRLSFIISLRNIFSPEELVIPSNPHKIQLNNVTARQIRIAVQEWNSLLMNFIN